MLGLLAAATAYSTVTDAPQRERRERAVAAAAHNFNESARDSSNREGWRRIWTENGIPFTEEDLDNKVAELRQGMFKKPYVPSNF